MVGTVSEGWGLALGAQNISSAVNGWTQARSYKLRNSTFLQGSVAALVPHPWQVCGTDSLRLRVPFSLPSRLSLPRSF